MICIILLLKIWWRQRMRKKMSSPMRFSEFFILDKWEKKGKKSNSAFQKVYKIQKPKIRNQYIQQRDNIEPDRLGWKEKTN